MDENERYLRTGRLLYTAFAALAILAVLFAAGLLDPLVYMVRTCDFPGAARFYGLQEDHWLPNLILTLSCGG